jgi:hypothetical protein
VLTGPSAVSTADLNALALHEVSILSQAVAIAVAWTSVIPVTVKHSTVTPSLFEIGTSNFATAPESLSRASAVKIFFSIRLILFGKAG